MTLRQFLLGYLYRFRTRCTQKFLTKPRLAGTVPQAAMQRVDGNYVYGNYQIRRSGDNSNEKHLFFL